MSYKILVVIFMLGNILILFRKPCSFCNNNFNHSIFTENLFSCKNCDKKYSNIKSFNQHIKIHNVSKSFKCDVCLKIFLSKAHLKIHHRTHTGEKPFECEVCKRKFAEKSNLVRHQATHSDVRNFKCSICPEGRFFKTKDGLNHHMVYHYEPKLACSHCEYKTYTRSNLKKHEKTHG